jgi:arginase
MSNPKIHIIGAAIGLGAPRWGTQNAPDFLSRHLETVEETIDGVLYKETIRAPELEDKLKALKYFSARLSDSVKDSCAYQSGWNQAWVIGGDHTCAIGTWSGIRKAFKVFGPVGLIWMDAHMDAHTPETSTSGNFHGMPLAVLLGHGDKDLVNLGIYPPTLKPENVCVVGVRDYEEKEKKLLEDLGVKYFTMDDINNLGFKKVMEEAKRIVKKNSYVYGVTIDLDVLDPQDFMCVNTPSKSGLSKIELIEELSGISKDEEFIALEIAEFNPYSLTGIEPLARMNAEFIEKLLINIGV